MKVTFTPGLYVLNELVTERDDITSIPLWVSETVFTLDDTDCKIGRISLEDVILVLGPSQDKSFTKVIVNGQLGDILTLDETDYVRTNLLKGIDI